MDRVNFRDSIAPKQGYVLFALDFLSQPGIDISNNKLTRRSEKILPIAKEQDVVFINETINRDYWEWLRSVNLSTDKIYEFNAMPGISLPKLILKYKEEVLKYLDKLEGENILIPNYPGPLELNVARTLGVKILGNETNISDRFYDKGFFKQFAKHLGIPVSEGELVDMIKSRQELEEIVKKYLPITGKVLIKGTNASFGRDTFSIDTQLDKKIINQITINGRYVIEVEYDIDYEINDQWLIVLQGDISPLGTSYFSVRNRKSNGNRFPIINRREKEEINSYSFNIAKAKQQAGYRGPFGIDYIKTKDGRLLAIEDNARPNGSLVAFGIYDLVIDITAARGFRNEFIKLKNPISFRKLKDECKSILYDGTRKDAFLFPYDITSIQEDGRFRALFIGSSNVAKDDLYHEFSSQYE